MATLCKHYKPRDLYGKENYPNCFRWTGIGCDDHEALTEDWQTRESDAIQAQNDPQQRKDFFSKSLNIYTAAMRAYFNIEEFRASDRKYKWTLAELAKMPIDWYGGADLSKMHDLTAGD